MYYINLSNSVDKRIKFKNQRNVAKKIGIAPETLSRILTGKQATQKTTALCIVKLYNSKAEIEDYFVKESE